jgi:cytosine/adenosine deaminase-related metal-dependent hydrolase
VYATGSEVMHTADLHFSTRDALEAATVNGAHACWLGDRAGSLTPGKRADVILVRATDSNLWPASDVVATLVGCGSGLNVDTVLVDGEFAKRDGQLTRLDIRQVRAGLARSRDRLYATDNYPGIRPLTASAGNGETRSS